MLPVPCVMLSVLTLLTFWLPTTSGEKISLGLSVFLAFSMFMLLIAEEVPATSESIPLVGKCPKNNTMMYFSQNDVMETMN